MVIVKAVIEPIEDKDLDEVMIIERLSFPTPWPENAFLTEMHQNQLAHYVVARLPIVAPISSLASFSSTSSSSSAIELSSSQVAGYAGVWIVIDEAHVTTIAVHPDLRGKKIGEQLLYYLLKYAIGRNARWATLEVRESNKGAQALYKKYGFSTVGVRKNYYVEEGENAVIMWAGNLKGEGSTKRLESLGKELEESFIC